MNEPLKTIRKCTVCGKEFIIQRGSGYLFKRQNYKTRKTGISAAIHAPGRADGRNKDAIQEDSDIR